MRLGRCQKVSYIRWDLFFVERGMTAGVANTTHRRAPTHDSSPRLPVAGWRTCKTAGAMRIQLKAMGRAYNRMLRDRSPGVEQSDHEPEGKL